MGKEDAVIQNLMDAGCTQDVIERFMSCCQEWGSKEPMRLLAVQRNKLICQIRDGQRKLDCLDYLIYQWKKE
mgnify:CR=1 FL=1